MHENESVSMCVSLSVLHVCVVFMCVYKGVDRLYACKYGGCECVCGAGMGVACVHVGVSVYMYVSVCV